MKNNRDTYKKYKLNKFLNKISFKRRKKIKEENFKIKYSSKYDAPMHLAFIVDGIVEDIIHCDDRLGNLLLSVPKVVEIDSRSEININWKYDEKNERFYQ